MLFHFAPSRANRVLHSFPTRRSSDLDIAGKCFLDFKEISVIDDLEDELLHVIGLIRIGRHRSEEHTSELQSRRELVCRLLLEKKKFYIHHHAPTWLNRLLSYYNTLP